ncbi:MAG TPA: sensor domain-containing protein, partial [Rugosimonospora sp.]|nr:sensor domain-containing protein [Rugosimonospora sp.]
MAVDPRGTLDAVERLVGGLGTAVLALLALVAVVVTAAASVLGVGVLVAPLTLRAVRVVADRERARLGRCGPPVVS